MWVMYWQHVSSLSPKSLIVYDDRVIGIVLH
jgi:hypothetical protein